jgi:hypothetical protein
MQKSELLYEIRKLLDFYTFYEEDEYGVVRLQYFQDELFIDALMELLCKMLQK